MTRELLLGTAAALLITIPASALTMTVVKDVRLVQVRAVAGNNEDANDDFADALTFTGEVSAHATEFEVHGTLLGDADTGQGAWAEANARQHSEIGALSISGEGSANASGSPGNLNTSISALVGGGGGLRFGNFEAEAFSTIRILFNIDEAAEFNLSGFISAGIEQAEGVADNAVDSFASVFFGTEAEEEVFFEREVFEDGLKFDETGIIGPGNYVFSIRPRADVFGRSFAGAMLGESDSGGEPQDLGYSASSRFGGNLELRAIDQPIPEPVTTSLIAMGLGALVLRTSRRQRV